MRGRGGGKERYLPEVGAVHLFAQRNRLKIEELCSTFVLVDCCSSVGDHLCAKEGPGCGKLEQEPDSQRALMEEDWVTSHG